MIKPESLEKFILLCENMEHRERFVFKTTDKQKFIEVYKTFLINANTDNICLSVVDCLGKGEDKANTSRWNIPLFKKVYDLMI